MNQTDGTVLDENICINNDSQEFKVKNVMSKLDKACADAARKVIDEMEAFRISHDEEKMYTNADGTSPSSSSKLAIVEEPRQFHFWSKLPVEIARRCVGELNFHDRVKLCRLSKIEKDLVENLEVYLSYFSINFDGPTLEVNFDERNHYADLDSPKKFLDGFCGTIDSLSFLSPYPKDISQKTFLFEQFNKFHITNLVIEGGSIELFEAILANVKNKNFKELYLFGEHEVYHEGSDFGEWIYDSGWWIDEIAQSPHIDKFERVKFSIMYNANHGINIVKRWVNSKQPPLKKWISVPIREHDRGFLVNFGDRVTHVKIRDYIIRTNQESVLVYLKIWPDLESATRFDAEVLTAAELDNRYKAEQEAMDRRKARGEPEYLFKNYTAEEWDAYRRSNPHPHYSSCESLDSER